MRSVETPHFFIQDGNIQPRFPGGISNDLADHITAEGAEDDIEARAKALADHCLADASKKGITPSEIGEAINDLPDFMLGAIESKKTAKSTPMRTKISRKRRSWSIRRASRTQRKMHSKMKTTRTRSSDLVPVRIQLRPQ